MPTAVLSDRGVVRVSGEIARNFLHGLVTTNVADLAAGQAAFAALLTPQGKILFDFFVVAAGDALLLEVSRDQLEALVKRLTFYRLRAKIEIADVSDQHEVAAIWDAAARPQGAIVYADPRLAALGARTIVPRGHFAPSADEAAYHAHRIRLGVPEGGKDYALGDTFPHEANLDQLNGVDFRKGCFVGQEVVSRMEHRGTARNRIVPVRGGTDLPAPGTPVEAEGASLGQLGSSAGADGLAMIRLDRAADALGRGAAIAAHGVPLSLVQPSWARFLVPKAGQAA